MNRRQRSHFTMGLILIVAGLVLLSSQLHLGRGIGQYWPVVFVIIGVGRLLGAPEDGRWGGAIWFLFLGGIFFLHTFDVLTLGDSWPLFIVAAGTSMLFSRSQGDRAIPPGSSGKHPEERQ